MRRKAEEKKKLGVLAMLDDDDTKQDGEAASGDEDSIDQIM